MFLVPTFLRSSSFIHTLRECLLNILLLSSALCFLVSPYMIDETCRNYKGNDITADIQQAIDEVQLMASSALALGHAPDVRFYRLFAKLFGYDRSRHNVVLNYFWKFSYFGPTDDFVVICDDLGVKWEPARSQQSPNPKGIWVDHSQKWVIGFDHFSPCDYTRKLGGAAVTPRAYTIDDRLIYLCPAVLDSNRGRSLAIFKDQDNFGQCIDTFMLLPAILFHELLHTHFFKLVDNSVRDFPTLEAFSDPNRNLYDPSYVSILPMVKAYGFVLCHKLGMDNPDLAVRNPDSVALCALALYLHKNDWAIDLLEGIAAPLTMP